jgi:bifunctional enzyme CysN/CysC
MTHLDQLESESIYILREAFCRIERLGMLWSCGKDSNVLVWLAKKAFLGHVPFPVVTIDTGKKMPEIYEFRDRYTKEWQLDLVVGACPPVEEIDPTLPPAARSAARKTAGLKLLIAKHDFRGLISGTRGDEEGTRAKEPRRNFGDQPPEFWDQFNSDLPPGAHLRVHPLLHWTEADVWRYIRQENIPVVDLYFAKNGKRFRTLGDKDLTFTVDSDAATFDEIVAEIESTRVPERSGEDLCARADKRADMINWFAGPTLIEALDAIAASSLPADLPLRMVIQDVYKFDERRIIAGRIESGQLRTGDMLLFSPGSRRALVATIESWKAPSPRQATAGQSVGVTLAEDVFVERGQVASHEQNAPKLTNVFHANIFWLGHTRLTEGEGYRMRIGAREVPAIVERVEKVADVTSLASAKGEHVERNGVAEVVIRTRGVLPVDDFALNQKLGRFVLIDGYEIVGGGIIDARAYPDQRESFAPRSENIGRVEHRVSSEQRVAAFGHRGGILWMTGLSAAGKSTLAAELERALFLKGYQVFLLDGDNIRHGLSADLGFSPQDRAENIRRVGEVASLFAEAGMIVISAFISPYRADRDRIRTQHPEIFHEVYINAPLEVCERRDPKGLYRKARAGEVKEFTGISSPYEPPLAPELALETDRKSVEECVAILAAYVNRHFRAVTSSAPIRRRSS